MPKREELEILAPVGGEEQLLAAVRCGADAVFLGGKNFNARRNASNFDESDLAAAVAYCHARGVKVYVTMNTIVMDNERRMLEEEAEYIAAAGADGAIIQDMSVLRLFASRYPTIERIASTQTAVHNTDGARQLVDAGFDSVVLARELTLDEMAKITSAVPVRMEAFVHGAHCMSLSGACYLSSMIGARSGNRGRCAQPCRLDWSCGGKNYALSLKDMSLISHIRDMADAGVSIFKIEGRLKRPEYVAAAVTACKNALEGREYDEETLRAVFSRSGFSDGYLTGRRDAGMFGYRTREDVVGTDGVLKQLAGLYRAETPRVAVDMHFELGPQRAVLTVSDGQRRVTAQTEAVEPARTRDLDAPRAELSLTKTGGTPYFVREFTADIEPGLSLAAAQLNALRREALGALDEERSRLHRHEKCEHDSTDAPRHSTGDKRPALWARYYKPEQISGEDALERIILPLERVTEQLIAKYGERLTAQLPTLLFPEDEDALEARLCELREAGLGSVWVNNIYGIGLARRLGLEVHGGFGLNAANTGAMLEYERLGLESITVSFEPPMSRIRELGGAIPRGAAAYGRLPLMHFRNCPVRAAVGCAKCGACGTLTDRRRVEFPVECGDRKFSMLLNSVPLDIAGQELPGLDYLLLYFTRESAAEAAEVTARFVRGEKTEDAHTKGLYYRSLE